MKNLTYVLFLLLFINCSKEDFSHQYDFEKSYQAFQNFKIFSNGNYDYQTDWGSWTGHSGTTIISVRNIIVVQQDYKMSFPPDMANITDSMRAKNAWRETQNELNTHPDWGAFDPIILDSVYERAKNIWLKRIRIMITILKWTRSIC
ncbi:hypothetical protein [Rhizosphaericola mali]|uniref:Uncharacterized protein n=1 Tax=Rhizosphaericola mali TaxID=2545455 RepID=A0A5P2G7G8_9BACT|nr:hypothetical protein [Rhizosphaericola mali]QES90219.1 hypothetical protein E0W69_016705 [Rhizosphaericola mali]